jgi:uncharacterized protein (TIGR03437 family)
VASKSHAATNYAGVLLTVNSPKQYGDAPVDSINVSAAPGGPAPTGTVTLRDGAQVLWTGSPGIYTKLSLPVLAVGTHSLAVSYSGDGSYLPSSFSDTLAITRANSWVNIEAKRQGSGPVIGLAVQMKANGLLNGGQIGTRPVSGSMTFRDGGTVIQQMSLDPTGAAYMPQSILSPGTHTVTADYAGDSNYAPSSASMIGVIGGLVPTQTVILRTSLNPTFGTPVQVSIHVYSDDGVPGGGVSLIEAGKTIGANALDPDANVLITLNSISGGSHNVVASYSAAPGFASSTSAPFMFVVAPVNSTVILTPLAPGYPSQPISLRVLVSSAVHGNPTGTVTFKLGSSTFTATVGAGGSAFLGAALPPTEGAVTLTAAYSGDDNYRASSSDPQTVTVTRASSAISITPPLGSLVEGDATTLPVVVSSSVSAPFSGTVNLLEGAVTLASNTVDQTGHCSITVAHLTAGVHVISASYAGNGTFAPSQSASLQLTVKAAPPVVVVSAASGSAPVAPDSLVTVFGTALSATTVAATSTPPPLELGGIRVDVLDALGHAWPAPLFYVSPTQVNFLLPRDASIGLAQIGLVGSGRTITGTVMVANAAPSLFTADASGKGAAVGYTVTAHADGSRDQRLIFECDASGCRTSPIYLGAGLDQTVLVLFGTGMRNGTDPFVRIGNRTLRPSYAGAQSEFPGLDQVNVPLPADLAGGGELQLIVGSATVESKPVLVNIR